MATMTYKEQLLHPNWQRKRLSMLDAAGWACSCCGGEDATLHVHHKRYTKGKMAWEYPDSELEVLCAACHQQEHANRDLLDALIAKSDFGGGALPLVIGLLGGYLHATLSIDDALANSAIAVDGHSYDLGVLASMASGSGWPEMRRAAEVVRGNLPTNPVEDAVLARWGSVDVASGSAMVQLSSGSIAVSPDGFE